MVRLTRFVLFFSSSVFRMHLSLLCGDVTCLCGATFQSCSVAISTFTSLDRLFFIQQKNTNENKINRIHNLYLACSQYSWRHRSVWRRDVTASHEQLLSALCAVNEFTVTSHLLARNDVNWRWLTSCQRHLILSSLYCLISDESSIAVEFNFLWFPE